MRFTWKKRAASSSASSSSKTSRPSTRMGFSWDALEGRTVMSHVGGFHHHLSAVASAAVGSVATASNPSTTSSTTSTNTALTTALMTLRTDIEAIEKASGTTVGELAAIHTTFQTLRNDGLTPTSPSALAAFENSLVTSFASGTTLTNNPTLLAQFEALYTTTPTTQETTDLTAAYNALASAVTSSNITSANITTVNTDYAAVLSAEGSTSTSTYPYFKLVTGGNTRFVGGFGVAGHGHNCG